MKSVLVLCTGNSCRSQMAEGYLRKFSEGRLNVYSAGLVAHGLNPKAVQVMREDGVDISGQTSNPIEDYSRLEFDFIITVCDHAAENCPYFPSHAIRIHNSFSDPSFAQGNDEEIDDAFRRTRDEIRTYCQRFINEKSL